MELLVRLKQLYSNFVPFLGTVKFEGKVIISEVNVGNGNGYGLVSEEWSKLWDLSQVDVRVLFGS